jgi:hypothetical protein
MTRVTGSIWKMKISLNAQSSPTRARRRPARFCCIRVQHPALMGRVCSSQMRDQCVRLVSIHTNKEHGFSFAPLRGGHWGFAAYSETLSVNGGDEAVYPPLKNISLLDKAKGTIPCYSTDILSEALFTSGSRVLNGDRACYFIGKQNFMRGFVVGSLPTEALQLMRAVVGTETPVATAGAPAPTAAWIGCKGAQGASTDEWPTCGCHSCNVVCGDNSQFRADLHSGEERCRKAMKRSSNRKPQRNTRSCEHPRPGSRVNRAQKGGLLTVMPE